VCVCIIYIHTHTSFKWYLPYCVFAPFIPRFNSCRPQLHMAAFSEMGHLNEPVCSFSRSSPLLLHTEASTSFFQSQINSGYALKSYVSMCDILLPSSSSSCAWHIPFVFSDYNSMCMLLVFLSHHSRCSNVHRTAQHVFTVFPKDSYLFCWRQGSFLRICNVISAFGLQLFLLFSCIC